MVVCGKGSSGAPKEFFYDILRTRKLTEEVLLTTFCLVEQSLNNRPLKAVSSDPIDREVLTTIHFLPGHRAISSPHYISSKTSIIESATPVRNPMQTPFGLIGSVSTYQHITNERKGFPLQNHT